MTQIRVRDVFKEGYVDDRDNYYVGYKGKQVCELRDVDWDDDRFRILDYKNDDIDYAVPYPYGDTLLDVARLVNLSAEVIAPDAQAVVRVTKDEILEAGGTEENWRDIADSVEMYMNDSDTLDKLLEEYIAMAVEGAHEDDGA